MIKKINTASSVFRLFVFLVGFCLLQLSFSSALKAGLPPELQEKINTIKKEAYDYPNRVRDTTYLNKSIDNGDFRVANYEANAIIKKQRNLRKSESGLPPELQEKVNTIKKEAYDYPNRVRDITYLNKSIDNGDFRGANYEANAIIKKQRNLRKSKSESTSKQNNKISQTGQTVKKQKESEEKLLPFTLKFAGLKYEFQEIISREWSNYLNKTKNISKPKDTCPIDIVFGYEESGYASINIIGADESAFDNLNSEVEGFNRTINVQPMWNITSYIYSNLLFSLYESNKDNKAFASYLLQVWHNVIVKLQKPNGDFFAMLANMRGINLAPFNINKPSPEAILDTSSLYLRNIAYIKIAGFEMGEVIAGNGSNLSQNFFARGMWYVVPDSELPSGEKSTAYLINLFFNLDDNAKK